MTPLSHRFPSTAWAWPTGALDQLIRAAIAPDPVVALGAFQAWLNEHDIDAVSFREHRLLAGIAARFGKTLADRPEYPRLVGLQRQLWTRSRMAMAEAAPLLQQLADRGIQVMLLKGGARIAAHPGDQTARVAHDLDILVAPARFAEAMEMLFNAGWSASSGESRLCLQARPNTIRAMNFFHGRLGDIDLHQWAYGGVEPAAGPQAQLWAKAVPAIFFGVPVLVPSATDRIALAICQSGLEAHTHSDWLVDCAHLIVEEAIDWPRLLTTLADLRSLVAAQVALGYLHQSVGIALPAGVHSELMAARGIGTRRRIADLLQAKPRTDWGWLSRIARGLVKQARLAADRKKQPLIKPVRGRMRRAVNTDSGSASTPLATRVALSLPGSGTVKFQLDLLVILPGPARRIEFEINTDQQHLLRLRARSLLARPGPVRLRFQGVLNLPSEAGGLWVEARPGRALREGETGSETARYGAVQFSVLSFDCRACRTPA